MPNENNRINPETGQPYPTQKEKLDEITASIEQGIKDVFNSENYRNYLSVMSRFHNYSVNNCMLIYMQNPNATRVASFKAWAEKFDRHVSKGEKGIKIIAPAPYKKKVDVEKIDPDTKKPVLDEEGNPITIEKEVTMPAFKAVTVFDVSQTQGKPLPEIVHSLNGNVENFEYLKDAIQRSAPVPIQFKELQENLDGFFSPKEQTITIRDGMSEPQTICAMLHETAHSILHNPETSEDKKARRNEEVEAESVAYAVCKYLGIDTEENSFGYLASWSSGKEVKELRESLDVINNTSSLLISRIEDNYREILAEKDLTPIESLTAKICNYLQNTDSYSYNDSVPEIVTDCLKKGDIKSIEDTLKLTLSQQENYPFNKTVSEKDKASVDLLLMEMKDYEKLNFTDVIYKLGDKAYLQIQRMDDGINYDFSFFHQNNCKLMDGGFTDLSDGDAFANIPMFSLAREIASDFNMGEYEITVADEAIAEEIEIANKIEDVADIGPKFIEEDKIKPPCPELTQETLDKFGYTSDGMYPITKEMAVELMQNYCDVYLLHDDGSEAMANDEQEILNHYGPLGVEKDTWNKIAYRYQGQKELDVKEKAFLESNKDGFAVYQLKPIEANDDIVFMNSQHLEKQGIPIDYNRYSFRYAGNLIKEDKTQEQTLDSLYEQFNFNKPADFHSRSVSVSDILALRQDGELTFHYVDSIGFREIPNFIHVENYLKNAEMQIEDDAGMVDGIINNGKKEEPEAKSPKKQSVLKKLEETKAKVAEGSNPTRPKARSKEYDN